MEKVKLTQEQASAINDCRNIVGDEMLIEMQVYRRNSPWRNKWNAINELNLMTLVDALRIGYEVESEFKSGDYVVNDIGTIGLIESVNGDHLKGVWIRDFDIPMNCTSNKIARHATPEEVEEVKERRWWTKHGRYVGEYKENDVVISRHTKEILYLKEVDNERYYLSDNSVYRDKEEMLNHYLVVCFAEDRKDV